MSQDEYTIAAYLVVSIVVRSASSILALLVFMAVAYTSLYASFVNPIDDVYLFPIISVIYLVLARLMGYFNDDAKFGCIFMSLYCLLYSFDSWAYGEHQTWLWRNHEVFVALAHTAIMLLLIKTRITMVFASIFIFWCGHCSSEINQRRKGPNHSA